MIAALVTPLALLNLLILFGLIRLWWKHKEARRRVLWVAIPFLLLYLLSTPPAAYLSLNPLERPYPPTEEVPSDAEAIVVLAGSIRDTSDGRAEPGPDTLYRCLHAAALHRKAPHLPVFLCGGPDWQGGPAYAHVMRDFLLGQGVPAQSLIVEDRSRTTYENAVESCRLLRERGLSRVVLVTDAAHMRRATGCFRAQGAEVTPSACNHIQPQYHVKPSHALPNVRSAAVIDKAFHEWVGLLLYQARGRL